MFCMLTVAGSAQQQPNTNAAYHQLRGLLPGPVTIPVNNLVLKRDAGVFTFTRGEFALYGEVNGSRRLFDRVKLIGHAGVLQLTAGATSDTGGHSPHADFLAGVEVEVKRFRLQFSRIAADGASRAYPVGSGHPAGVWVGRISAGF